MPLDMTLHPCFNSETRHRTGRIHLPVAPKCNIQCNFCNRKFDCMSESRPGVTSAVLEPKQALHYLEIAMEKMPSLAVVGIAGPGDPFASPQETLETLRLVRQRFPEMLLCVATNGLSLGPYVDELALLQVSHVTITVNAVDPAVGSKIYAWVRDGHTIHRGDSAARVLLQRQLSAITALKERSIIVKVNTILVPGINDDHVDAIATEMSQLGVDVMNCVPMYLVAGTPFENHQELEPEEIARLRTTAGRHLPQMTHCTRCRADAAGLLGKAQSAELVSIMRVAARGGFDDAGEGRPYVAVASMEGVLVNQHLGEASRFWIFESGGDGRPQLVGVREAPEAGGGNLRWRELAQSLHDCRAVLVSGIGHNPRRVLEQEGLRVLEMAGLISDGVASLYRTGDVPRTMRKYFKSCGAECQGSGMGCS